MGSDELALRGLADALLAVREAVTNKLHCPADALGRALAFILAGGEGQIARRVKS